MTHTIRVIPHDVIRFPDGREHSIFSASAADPGAQVVTKGWSWEVVRPDGTLTRGLCRRPVESHTEASRIAESYAYATGAVVLPQ